MKAGSAARAAGAALFLALLLAGCGGDKSGGKAEFF